MTGRASTFKECFSLLGDTTVLLCFIGIVCHVGIDVGTNVSAPRIIMDKLGLSLTEAGYATSVYFLFRTMGCLAGTFIFFWPPACSVCCFSEVRPRFTPVSP